MKINRKCNYADLDWDLIANVDTIRERYMKFATLPDWHRPLVVESSVDETVLWHLASACRKSLAAIVGDSTLAEVIYDAMGDSGESATWIIQNAWSHCLYKAAGIKQWNRNVAKFN